MTDCNCTCSHFDGPHDAEARHPNPKACKHAEPSIAVEHARHDHYAQSVTCDEPKCPLDWHRETDPLIAKWRDENGDTYFTVEPS